MIPLCRTLCALSFLAAFALPSPVGAATEKYRVLWNETPDSRATIAWCFSAAEAGDGAADDRRKAAVHYGTEDFGVEWERYPEQHGIDRRTEHKGFRSAFARLTDLQPDTLYYFVVRDEGDGSVSPRFSFRTAPDGPAEFTFVAGGDSRNHRDARQRANRVVSKLRPLFVCFGGDLTNRSTPQEYDEWLDDWQLTFGEDGRIFPLIVARGNHEHKDDVHALFDTPHPEDYYATSIGGDYLRLYTMNSNIVRAGEQGAWLERDLAEHDSAHWKLAQYHHPFRPHQSKKAEQNSQYNAWAKPFFEHGMNLVIECDSHVVKRTWPLRPSNEPGSDEGFIRDDEHGTVFIGEGCWGAPLRPADDRKSWTRDAGSFNQINWVHVTPAALCARTVLVDDSQSMAAVADGEPYAPPEGIRLWQAEHGEMVTVPARRVIDAPKVTDESLLRLEIVFGKQEFEETTSVRIEPSDELPEGWEIRYSLNGVDPGAGSMRYAEPLEIDETTTVRAVLVAGDEVKTAVAEATATKREKKSE